MQEEAVKKANDKIASNLKALGRSTAQIKSAQHDVKALRAEGLITDLNGQGMPVTAEKAVASKLFTLPTLVQHEIGKNKEGYWDGSNQAEQAKKVQKVMMILFPDYEIWHVYDW